MALISPALRYRLNVLRTRLASNTSPIYIRLLLLSLTAGLAFFLLNQRVSEFNPAAGQDGLKHLNVDLYPQLRKPGWFSKYIPYLDQQGHEWYYRPGELPIPGTLDPKLWYDLRRSNPPDLKPDLISLEEPITDADYRKPVEVEVEPEMRDANYTHLHQILRPYDTSLLPDPILGNRSEWIDPDWTMPFPSRPKKMPRIQASPRAFKKSKQLQERADYRKAAVRRAFFDAWTSYKTHAWGADEVGPLHGNSDNPYNGWAATLVDALDVLLLMDFQKEYEDARQIVKDLDFRINGNSAAGGDVLRAVPISTFETTIRYLGGLISAYDMSGDRLMINRAKDLAMELASAFHTSSGFPEPQYHLGTKPKATEKERFMLAEIALQLEFIRLAQLTGEDRWISLAHRGLDHLFKNKPGPQWLDDGFPPVTDHEGMYTMAARADSYFEYLLKTHLLTAGTIPVYGEQYLKSMKVMMNRLWQKIDTIPGFDLGNFVTRQLDGHTTPKLEHLGCFAGAMVAIGSRIFPERSSDWSRAQIFSDTCFFAYNHSMTGIQPEVLQFVGSSAEFRPVRVREKPSGKLVNTHVVPIVPHYIGRPEAIESIFHMYRMTGDEVWREKGWRMFVSWYRYCKAEFGMASLINVMTPASGLMNNQQSFVLAETFKYYYLLFSDENLISLDEWVFNTEAHPFSLTSKNGPAGGFWRGTATADDLKNTGRGTAVQIREKYRRLLSLRNIELTRKKKADAIEGQATKAPNKLVQTTSTVSGTTSDASRTISEDDHTASDEDQTSTDDGQTSTDDEPTTV